MYVSIPRFCFALLLSLCGLSALRAEPLFVPKAVKVTDDIYAFVGPLGQRSEANAGLNANYGFVITATGVILIDSGASSHSASMLEKAIKEVTLKPIRWVLNTGSQDHRWLGNAYFAKQGAEVHAMAGTIKTQRIFAQQQLDNLKRFVGDNSPARRRFTQQKRISLQSKKWFLMGFVFSG